MEDYYPAHTDCETAAQRSDSSRPFKSQESLEENSDFSIHAQHSAHWAPMPDKAPLPNWTEFNNFEEFQFIMLFLLIILFGGKIELPNYMKFNCKGILGQLQSPFLLSLQTKSRDRRANWIISRWAFM